MSRKYLFFSVAAHFLFIAVGAVVIGAVIPQKPVLEIFKVRLEPPAEKPEKTEILPVRRAALKKSALNRVAKKTVGAKSFNRVQKTDLINTPIPPLFVSGALPVRRSAEEVLMSAEDLRIPSVVTKPVANVASAAEYEDLSKYFLDSKRDFSGAEKYGSVEQSVDTFVPAVAISRINPPYPFYSRRHGEEGTVVVSIEVNPDGSVGEIVTLESSGYKNLDESVRSALGKTIFIPAMDGGGPLASKKMMSFSFRLDGAE